MSPYAGYDFVGPSELRFNSAMSSVRIEVEHGFATVVNNFPFLNDHHRMKIYASQAGTFYRFAVLMSNVLTCLHSNQIAQKFDCMPPSLNEYLHH